MGGNSKQISNPYSEGGGGVNFETRIQGSFVVLMLAGGFVPCLPCWPITKIKLQGKYAGFETDDLIVYIRNNNSSEERKLLGQIKHSISITDKNEKFGEVIQAAWNDFKNLSLFNKGKDILALITGPLSSTDTQDVRTVLEWARSSESAEEFLSKVGLAKFSSDVKRAKLQAFRVQLKIANDDNDVSDDELWMFLKDFHLLGYDLDIKAGITLSLLHSLIGQYSQENIENFWARIVYEVQDANQNAGIINKESLPEELQEVFKVPVINILPSDIANSLSTPEKTNWISTGFTTDLAIANLIGSWDEKSDADKEIISQLAKEDFNKWIEKIQGILANG